MLLVQLATYSQTTMPEIFIGKTYKQVLKIQKTHSSFYTLTEASNTLLTYHAEDGAIVSYHFTLINSNMICTHSTMLLSIMDGYELIDSQIFDWGGQYWIYYVAGWDAIKVTEELVDDCLLYTFSMDLE